MATHNKIDWPVQELRSLIEQGKKHQEVAEILAEKHDPRISRKLVTKACSRYGIKSRPRGPRSGEDHPEWKGGRRLNKDGYVEVYSPDHHTNIRLNDRRKADSAGKWYRKSRYALEHRLVMEKHLGRPLADDEVIHHINGVKTDNRLENLQLFDSNARHLAETLAGLCPKWSKKGIANMRAAAFLKAYPDLAQKYDYQQLGQILLWVQTELALDAPPSKVEFEHYLTQRNTTAQELCEMVSSLQQQQPAA